MSQGNSAATMTSVWSGGRSPYAVNSKKFGMWLFIISRSEEHTSELQSLRHLVCRLLLVKSQRGPWACARPVVYRAHRIAAGRLGAADGEWHRCEGCAVGGVSHFFFFLLIRGPPKSTLFPSPTLSR